jgi:hypothetical protein
MILAEPAIRPRAVDISRDRLMSRQAIFDAQIDCGKQMSGVIVIDYLLR